MDNRGGRRTLKWNHYQRLLKNALGTSEPLKLIESSHSSRAAMLRCFEDSLGYVTAVALLEGWSRSRTGDRLLCP